MIDQINDFLVNFLGPLGPLIAVGFLGFVMILLTLPLLLRKQVDPMDKLRKEVRTERNRRRRAHLHFVPRRAQINWTSTQSYLNRRTRKSLQE